MASDDPLERSRASEPAGLAVDELKRFVRASVDEVRNPLLAIRTLTALFPERFDDPEFRELFSQRVGNDIERIEVVLLRLLEMCEAVAPERESVDVSEMLEQLIEERRELIVSRSLLVLRELERSEPFAWVDVAQLRGVLSGLLDRAFEKVPERGDIYLASRCHHGGAGHAATLRILVRWTRERAGGDSSAGNVAAADAAPELWIADSVARAHGGQLTVEVDATEEVLFLDLPAREEPAQS